ncbi:MAG: shikimate dehydrogenase [Lentisphaeria bacterium]|nr:shikimate dehydrogenase [Lentisphaeria bacterium]
MLKYAVIGHPVGHSRSPGMQNAAFAGCGIDADYLKLEVRPEEFPEFLRFAKKHLAGFNLTVPHKQIVLPHLDTIDPEAERIGSVNTVKVLPGGKLAGCSTDGVGFEEAVRCRLGLELAGKSCLLLGCGGAARAVAFRIVGSGARRLTIANRTAERAHALAREVGAPAEVCALDDREGLAAALRDADLLVQATSLGLRPDDPPPVAPELLELNPRLALIDLVYLPTKLLRKAAELHLNACDGSEMLLRQGAASFRFWTGCKPPVEAMRRGMALDPAGCPAFDWRAEPAADRE